jgi:serine/threonine protein kinase
MDEFGDGWESGSSDGFASLSSLSVPPKKVEEPAPSTLSPRTCPPVDLNWLAPPQEPGEMGRLGPYRILGVLGGGGMGIVFRAEDLQLRRPVALKVLPPSSGDTAIARQRFLREARAAGALKHDHVITIYQVGEDRGVPYMAMELLQGESLQDRLKRQGRLPVADVLRIGREMALGLAAAHAQDMIHRDVKPDNVWLEGQAGRVKLLDFGLARVGGDVQITKAGTVVGTPAYMAPEQAAGKDVDARCDLFSLGSVLYQLVTGERPFRGHDPLTLLIAIANDTPIPPWEISRGMPMELSDLIMRLLAKDRRYRPASAREVIEALESIEQELAGIRRRVNTYPMLQSNDRYRAPQPIVPARPKVPRRWKSWLIAGLFGGMFLVALAVSRWLHVPKTAQPSRPRSTASPAKRRITAQWPVPDCLDDLRQQDIPASQLAAAGDGDPANAPDELVAVWPVAMPATDVTALAFSHDGKLLACGTPQGGVHLLKVPTGERTRLLLAHAGMIKHIAFLSDGKTLATAANDAQVRLWSIDSGERVANFEASDGEARPSAFSFDGKVLAMSSRGEKGDRLQLHRTLPGGPPTPLLRDSWFHVAALALSSRGLLAASDADRKTVRFWDARTGAALYSVSPSPDETASSLAFSPDGTLLAGTFVSTNLVRVWNAATGKQLQLLEGKPRTYSGQSRQDVAISPNNRTLAAVTSAGVIRLWDLSTGEPGKVIRLSPAVPNIDQIAFSPDGRHLATANSTGTVYILRVSDSSEQ